MFKPYTIKDIYILMNYLMMFTLTSFSKDDISFLIFDVICILESIVYDFICIVELDVYTEYTY